MQPHVHQGCADVLRIEGLHPLAPEQLLNLEVIPDHAQEAARGQQRVHVAEATGRDPAPDVIGQQFQILRHMGAEKAVCQLVVLERGGMGLRRLNERLETDRALRALLVQATQKLDVKT